MNFLLLFNFKLRILSLFFIIFLLHSVCIAQADLLKSPNICKQLAIQSAQLADQSHVYSQKGYFETKPKIIEVNVDSALSFIKESILVLDSVLVLASDSAKLGIKHAKIARNFAIDCYYAIIQSKKTDNYNQKKELLNKAIFYSANTTVDAYHASFYFYGDKKREKKDTSSLHIQITKLDIDQTLFALLKENLNEKSEGNKQEILKLSNELSNTKDPVKVSKLKTQLKTLELQGKDFDKKNEETQVKLSTINTLIENRDKNISNNKTQSDTIFSKNMTKTKDEWNNPVKLDTDIPNFLVYQIQLGVFKKAVPIENFKGFTPIYSNKTENGVSYSTGLFEKLADAKEAKNTIHSMGLTDAFIVAYYNKKKITLDEAIKLEKK